RQLLSRSSIWAAIGEGAVLPLSRRSSSGTITIALTSWVAAAFIAEVTVAGDHLPFRASRFRLKVSMFTRPTDPLRPHWSSAAPNPCATLLFQLVMKPCLLFFPCGWAIAFRKPRHSYLPVPLVSSPGSVPGGRIGRRPLVYSAKFLRSR